MNRLTTYVLGHRAIVVALLALFVVAGVNAFRHLPVEAYPDVTNVSFQVVTLFPGHAAEEVERLVTIPIENVMNGIPGRASIRSISLFGLSQITIVFEDDTDRAYVRNQAYQLLSTVPLPSGAQAGCRPTRRRSERSTAIPSARRPAFRRRNCVPCRTGSSSASCGRCRVSWTSSGSADQRSSTRC
jgi:Cu/Ag efflux pump CusA